MKVNLSKIGTELQNENTKQIDQLSTYDMVKLINQEDRAVISAVEMALDDIALAVDLIYKVIQGGGRLVYMGAGTSGRLGVLDASECLPTFGVGEESVVGLIAGGDRALRHPVEAAEDDKMAAHHDLKAINFTDKDVVCAIGASGRTPYCVGAIEYAHEVGAKAISLACVSDAEFSKISDIAIEAVVGQEVITGSTRMKSGSATKMVLNMLSTGAMIKLGKVYGNLMVDVKATNAKLVERAKSIIMKATDCDYDRASELLSLSNDSVKLAIVMELTQTDADVSRDKLKKAEGRIAQAIL